MNQAGLDLLKNFEGFRAKAYPDPGTGGEPWTIGYGFTKGVTPYDTITMVEADERLKREVQETEDGVLAACHRAPTPNQGAAMTCLAYNIGLHAFQSSTVLRRHDAGELYAAGSAFLLWNKSGGKVMPGLIRRREAERDLYLK